MTAPEAENNAQEKDLGNVITSQATVKCILPHPSKEMTEDWYYYSSVRQVFSIQIRLPCQ